MKKKVIITILSGLLVSTHAVGQWWPWPLSLFIQITPPPAQYSHSRPRQSAPTHASTAHLEIHNSVEAQLRHDLKCLNSQDLQGVCNLAKALISMSPVLQSSSIAQAAHLTKAICQSAVYTQLYAITDREINKMHIPDYLKDEVRNRTNGQLLQKLDNALKTMNGLDCKKIAQHFNRTNIIKTINQQNDLIHSGNWQPSAPVADEPPPYYQALGLDAATPGIAINIHITAPAHPEQWK